MDFAVVREINLLRCSVTQSGIGWPKASNVCIAASHSSCVLYCIIAPPINCATLLQPHSVLLIHYYSMSGLTDFYEIDS